MGHSPALRNSRVAPMQRKMIHPRLPLHIRYALPMLTAVAFVLTLITLVSLEGQTTTTGTGAQPVTAQFSKIHQPTTAQTTANRTSGTIVAVTGNGDRPDTVTVSVINSDRSISELTYSITADTAVTSADTNARGTALLETFRNGDTVMLWIDTHAETPRTLTQIMRTSAAGYQPQFSQL